jgi:hypothetical protein
MNARAHHCKHAHAQLYTIAGGLGEWHRILCAACGRKTEFVLSYALARQLWNETK